MASTFTPLGVELQATGENAGTWGDKTNTNLQLIEQIAGGFTTQSIAGGADSSIQHQHGLQFGYPQLIKLTSGDIFAVFWAVEDELSVIRCFHLQVES